MRRVVLVSALALLVTACGGARTSASKSARGFVARSQATPAALPNGSRLLLDAAQPLSWAYAGAGSLYFSYAGSVGEHVGEEYEMLRVDTTTGGIKARRQFTSAPDATVLADRSLWVTTTTGGRTTLWRLDPGSLAVRSIHGLPSSPHNEGISGSLAVAGAQLWVGTGLLDGVSLRTGRLERVVAPRHRGPVQVAADHAGRVLLASLGYEHPTYIDRLDPVTGAPMSELRIPKSDLQPSFGGILNGGAWIQNAVGAKTSVWRVSLNSMKATKPSARWTPANRVSVRALDGVLWVTESVGQNNLNYCANPVSGRALSRLPLLPGNSVFLTATRTTLFYTDVPLNAHTVKLESAPVSRACTSH